MIDRIDKIEKQLKRLKNQICCNPDTIRYNEEEGYVEIYQDGEWQQYNSSTVRYNEEEGYLEIYTEEDGWVEYISEGSGGGGGEGPFQAALTEYEASPNDVFLESPFMRIPIAAGQTITFEMFTIWADASTNYALTTKFTTESGNGIYAVIKISLSAMGAGEETTVTVGTYTSPYEYGIEWEEFPNYQQTEGNVIVFKGIINNHNENDDVFILNHKTQVGYIGAQLSMQPLSYIKYQIVN